MSVQQNPIVDFHTAPLPAKSQPTAELSHQGVPDYKDEKALYDPAGEDVTITAAQDQISDDLIPTEEDMLTLRKVPAPMTFAAWSMCLIEFSERASYYGSIGPFNNFINRPLPDGGNGAGAVAPGAAGLNQSAGALGMGSVAATGIVQMFTFLAYVIPFYGAICADTQIGRFKAIAIGTAVGALAHIMLVIPAIPQVIAVPKASLATFIISIITLAGAAGFIKPSLGPLLCDQIPVKQPTLSVTKKGERVIIDPGVTVERWLLLFYWSINIGAFTAIATSYSARFIGFWLAFLIPGILYMIMPLVLIFINKRLYKAPPQGSVLVEAIKVFKTLLSDGGMKRMWKGGDDFWNRAKPSWIASQNHGHLDITKVFWDDKFVDELKQSVHACAVFFIIPIFNLGNGGIGNSLNSMSTAMTLNGAPNDLISNFNALAIVIATPILNFGLYPFMTRIGWPLRPMTRLCIGFLLASVSNIAGALIQWRIYQTSPCGWQATTDCEAGVSPVSLWYQILIVTPPAIGELFVNVTAYELAYTRSPARMKGFVYSFTLFNQAISAAVMLALAGVIRDPWLVWPWTAMACITFCTAWVFPTRFKHLNVPMKDFADRDRQAGLHQPKAIAEGKAAEGGVSQ